VDDAITVNPGRLVRPDSEDREVQGNEEIGDRQRPADVPGLGGRDRPQHESPNVIRQRREPGKPVRIAIDSKR
jgi:hypothetical protein